MRNLADALAAAGSALTDVVKTTIFVAAVDYRMVDNALARRLLGGSPEEVPEVWDRLSLLPLAGQTWIPVLIMSAGDPKHPGKQAKARWHTLLPTSQHLSFPNETHTPSPSMRAEAFVTLRRAPPSDPRRRGPDVLPRQPAGRPHRISRVNSRLPHPVEPTGRPLRLG